MYYGLGKDIPKKLEAAKAEARAARLEANSAVSCTLCWPQAEISAEALAAA